MKCAICRAPYDTLSCNITMSSDSQKEHPQYDMDVCEKCYYCVLEKILMMDVINAKVNQDSM